MSSVWDDPDFNEDDEVTPLPGPSAADVPLPLPPEKLEAMAAEIIERVVREVVPELAERMIRAELDRLLKETE